MIPEKIDRYEIKSELGRGGMATVYLATDPRFKREVAVKVLPREFLHDPTFRARFEREAQAIASLEHPAIVPVYDFGEEASQPYLVMRFMSGGSLARELKRGLLSLEETVRIMARLAPALDEAHAKGIIHRDLKPANILFDQRGDPYISDFGLARLSEVNATFTGSLIVGTPAYISPEQAQGGGGIDRRSDVYALGVILFEMLTGQLPYTADTPMGLVVKHITEPVPRILKVKPDLLPGCETVIARAMAKERERRFATAGEMATVLEKVVKGEVIPPVPVIDEATLILPAEAEATPPPPPVQRPRKRPIWGWIRTSLLALGMLGAFLARGSQLPAIVGPVESLASTATSPTPTDLPAHAATSVTPFTPASLPTIEPSITAERIVGLAPSQTPAKPTSTLLPPPVGTKKATVPIVGSIGTSTPEAAQTSWATNIIPTSTMTPREVQPTDPATLTATSPAPSQTRTPTSTLVAPPTITPLPPATRTPTPLPSNTPSPLPSATPSPTQTDVQGPGLSGFDASPTTVTLGACTVTFKANISDPSGVAAASVEWNSSGLTGGSSGSAGMALEAGDVWSVSFPVTIPAGGHLDWSVKASDTFGNVTTQSSGIRITAVLSCL